MARTELIAGREEAEHLNESDYIKMADQLLGTLPAPR